MAITLNVSDYCQECENFEPRVEKAYIDACWKGFCDTNIYCEHKNLCERLVCRLEEQMEAKKEG